MRLPGYWVRNQGEIPFPVMTVRVSAAGGEPVEAEFLIDTGAENTILTADLVRELALPSIPSAVMLGGVGGEANAVETRATFHFIRDDGGLFRINVQCYAFVEANRFRLSILGRDVLNLFSMIVDHPGRVVCLLTGRHRYVIQES